MSSYCILLQSFVIAEKLVWEMMEVHPRQSTEKEQVVCHPEIAAAFSNPDENKFPVWRKRVCGCFLFLFLTNQIESY